MNAPDFSLIETMRFEPEHGIVNLHLHRSRLARSARTLGLPFDAGAFDAALSRLSKRGEVLRVRLELLPNGEIRITDAPHVPLAQDVTWRVRIAGTRLSSGDRMLRHKTSRRDAYIAARAEFSADEADEVLLLNERGEICEGSITSLFLPVDGGFLTPPLTSGLLAGVKRAALLRSGRARTAVILPDDIAGKVFYVGNALRGLITARLAS